MNQLFSVKKDSNNTDILWWRPLFKMQRELNHKINGAFSSFRIFPSFIAPSPTDTQEEFLASAQHEVHRIFSEIFNNRQMLTLWCTGAGTEPYIDITENDNDFKIKADVTGLNAKDLDVLVSDCAITIKSQRQEKKAMHNDNYIHRECNSDSFSRTIALPEDADVDNAKANFEDNALTIKVPKKSSSKQKALKLKIENEPESLPPLPLKSSSAKSEQKPAVQSDEDLKDKKIKAA